MIEKKYWTRLGKELTFFVKKTGDLNPSLS